MRSRTRRLLGPLFAAGVFAGACLALWPRDRIEVYSQTLTVDGEQRSLRTAVPDSWPGQQLPLLLVFHGVGGSADGMARSSQLDGLAAQRKCIVVYPEAIRGMWKTVNVNQAGSEKHPDIRFVDRAIEYLSGRFPIDPDRIYAAGMSNGGTFAEMLALSRPRRFAAIAIHSAPTVETLRTTTETERKVPLLMIVGAQDTQASPDHVNDAAQRFTSLGYPVDVVILPELGHRWNTAYNDDLWRFLSQHSSD